MMTQCPGCKGRKYITEMQTFADGGHGYEAKCTHPCYRCSGHGCVDLTKELQEDVRYLKNRLKGVLREKKEIEVRIRKIEKELEKLSASEP
jgi:transcription termination factor NusB